MKRITIKWHANKKNCAAAPTLDLIILYSLIFDSSLQTFHAVYSLFSFKRNYCSCLFIYFFFIFLLHVRCLWNLIIYTNVDTWNRDIILWSLLRYLSILLIILPYCNAIYFLFVILWVTFYLYYLQWYSTRSFQGKKNDQTCATFLV